MTSKGLEKSAHFTREVQNYPLNTHVANENLTGSYNVAYYRPKYVAGIRKLLIHFPIATEPCGADKQENIFRILCPYTALTQGCLLSWPIPGLDLRTSEYSSNFHKFPH